MIEKTNRIKAGRYMAILCIGIFTDSILLNVLDIADKSSSLLWMSFQYGFPLIGTSVLPTGKFWALMAGIIYGTIGLALDIATLVQSMMQNHDSMEFIILILINTLLNASLVLVGGKGILKIN